MSFLALSHLSLVHIRGFCSSHFFRRKSRDRGGPVLAIIQEPNENPIAFLERLKEALQKFTNLDLDSYEGQVILKDKFLSQYASDIRIRLLTVASSRTLLPL